MYNAWSAELVITDSTMPKKKGMETMKEILKINPALNIIVISTSAYSQVN